MVLNWFFKKVVRFHRGDGDLGGIIHQRTEQMRERGVQTFQK